MIELQLINKIYYGEMAEWSIASDLKSDEPYGFREFESHSLLIFKTIENLD